MFQQTELYEIAFMNFYMNIYKIMGYKNIKNIEF